MSTDQPEPVPVRTEIPSEELRRKFGELVPGVINDGVIDVRKLSELLGVETAGDVDSKERFGLMWAGRGNAVKALQEPSLAALVPDMESSIGWDTAKNVFIEGDNLEVLKLLQKAYNDQVDLIYIDPPYNTGNDFVYNDDFSDTVQRYLEVSGQVDGEGNRLVANTDVSGRKHSKWISMMYPRLMLARNMLKENGIFVASIDDNEVNNFSMLLDEVFGEQNRLARLIWNRGHSQQQGIFKQYHEYLLVYARDTSKIRHFNDPEGGDVIGGALKKISKANPASNFKFPSGVRVEAPDGTEFKGTWGEAEKTTLVDGEFVVANGRTTAPMVLSAGWTQKNQMTALFSGDEAVFDSKGQRVLEFYFNSSGKLKYRKERTAYTPPTVHNWGTQGSASKFLVDFLNGDYFDQPKPVNMLQELVAWIVPRDGSVVDFFAGSGTTGHAVALQNALDGGTRRYVLVNAPEKTAEKSSARAAGFETIPEITRLRLGKVTSAVPGAEAMGLRCLTLGPSSFVDTTPQMDGIMPLLVENTLRSDAADDEIAAEVLLKSGVRLDEEWVRASYGGTPVVRSGSVGVVLAREAADEVVSAAVADPHVQTSVFLEDSFAESDGIKANAHFAFRTANKTMRTM